MAQHFLLSAAARTLSLKAIYAEGEDAAYDQFCKLRWPATAGAPVCPRCAWQEVEDGETVSEVARRHQHMSLLFRWRRDYRPDVPPRGRLASRPAHRRRRCSWTPAKQGQNAGIFAGRDSATFDPQNRSGTSQLLACKRYDAPLRPADRGKEITVPRCGYPLGRPGL